MRAMDRLREDSPNSLEFRGGNTAYTFLVPSDQAFQRLGPAKLQHLLANTTLLARVSTDSSKRGCPGRQGPV